MCWGEWTAQTSLVGISVCVVSPLPFFLSIILVFLRLSARHKCPSSCPHACVVSTALLPWRTAVSVAPLWLVSSMCTPQWSPKYHHQHTSAFPHPLRTQEITQNRENDNTVGTQGGGWSCLSRSTGGSRKGCQALPILVILGQLVEADSSQLLHRLMR